MAELYDLGPTTERRFAEAFATTAVITAKAAACLIGVDEKTLCALSDDKVIRSVPRGKLRAYTERDLRAYLLEEHDLPCPSTKPQKAGSGSTTSKLKVVAFSDRRGRLRDAPPRSSRSASAGKSAKASTAQRRT